MSFIYIISKIPTQITLLSFLTPYNFSYVCFITVHYLITSIITLLYFQHTTGSLLFVFSSPMWPTNHRF